MKYFLRSCAWTVEAFFFLLFGAAGAARAQQTVNPAVAEQLLALANQSRAQAGEQPLKWDTALTTAALAHCRRMAVESALSHGYAGELDLPERAHRAGAHFSVIEENIAQAASAAEIHAAWMASPPHRKNLLNAAVDRVGIAVVASRGALFAVADYAQGSEALTAAEVERRVAGQIAVSGVRAESGSVLARAACTMDRGMPRGLDAGFVMRWEDTDLSRVPDALAAKLASGSFHHALVGSCPAHNRQGGFTLYRVAVVLQ